MCQQGSNGNPSLKMKDETEREEQDDSFASRMYFMEKVDDKA